MFETHEAARVDVPAGLADEGEYVWEFIYSRLHMHWFHVVAENTHEVDGYRELRIFYFIRVEDLLAITESPDWEVTEADLMSPGHMNGTGRWAMDPLVKILKGRESRMEHEQYGYVFVLENGERYAWSFSNCEEDLTDLKSIYEADT